MAFLEGLNTTAQPSASSAVAKGLVVAAVAAPTVADAAGSSGCRRRPRGRSFGSLRAPKRRKESKAKRTAANSLRGGRPKSLPPGVRCGGTRRRRQARRRLFFF